MLCDILTFLTDLDSSALLLLNSLHTPILDQVMYSLTNKWLWIAFSAILVYFVFRHGGAKKGILCLLCLGLALTLSDQICASMLRPSIGRLRPSNLMNPISPMVHVVNDYRSGRFGFPSCHGSTTMAVVVFLALYFRNRKVTISLVCWSILLCYTRIYLGVHYPGDILCGMFIGSIAALISYGLYRGMLKVHWSMPRMPRLPFHTATD